MKKTTKHAAAVLLGSLGGQARAKKLTVAERTAIARKAARTRSKNLTPARRREIAMMGVRARLAKLRARRKAV